MDTHRGKSNKEFMLLSAIGIIFVVDAHAWTSLSLFTAYIPYNSFFMPMFVFISGYFFKPESAESMLHYIGRKFKRLMFPYYLWNFFFLALELILHHFKLISYDYISLSDVLIKPWTSGIMLSVCSPMWFVPALFATEVVYRFFSKCICINNILLLIILVIAGAASVYISTNYSFPESMLLPLKIVFFLQFYQIGYVYKYYKIDTFIHNLKYKGLILVSLLGVNTLRQLHYPNTYAIAFNDLATMSGFTTNNCFLPVISSVIGIGFWCIVVDILTPVLKNNAVLNYISDNTFWIMACHIFMFNVFNIILILINNYIHVLPGFDLKKIHETAGYRFEPTSQFRIFYLAAGLFGALLSKKLFDYVAKKIRILKK